MTRLIIFISIFALCTTDTFARGRWGGGRSRGGGSFHGNSSMSNGSGSACRNHLMPKIYETKEDTLAHMKGEPAAEVKRVLDFIYEESTQNRIRRTYNRELIPLIQRWQKQTPKMTTTQLAMNIGVMWQGGKSILGVMDSRACASAQDHAYDMACRCHQDHNGAGARMGQFGAGEEIVGQTFDGKHDIISAALECADWKSGGHRSAMMGTHRLFCYDMRKVTSGTWYCVGLFGN